MIRKKADLKNSSYWTDKRISGECRKIVAEHGELLSRKGLCNLGYTALAAQIDQKGGFIEMRKKLGLKIIKRHGYWTDKKVLQYARKVVAEKGYLPAKDELNRLGYGDLAGQIERRGGYTHYKEKLGIDDKRKPLGFWRDWDNAKSELESMIDSLGHFPSQNEIQETGHASLSTAIVKYHGGLTRARKELGYEEERKPRGYWKSKKNVKKELERASKKLGHFPSSVDLGKLGLSTLVVALKQHHGGIQQIRDEMGYEPGIKSMGYWQNTNNILEEAKTTIRDSKSDILPSERELRRLGKQSLAVAISKYYPDGMRGLRKNLGEESSHKPNGYWEKWENCEPELQSTIERLGNFPTQTELSELGLSTLNYALTRYHGGFTAVRERMNYEVTKRQDGYWKDWKLVKDKLEEIIKEEGELPGSSRLRELGHFGMLSGINKYHGGIKSVRKRLDQNVLRNENGHWGNEKNILTALKGLISDLGHFPSTSEIKEHGDSGLMGGITAFGGVNKLREAMGYDALQRSRGYWQNVDNALSEARQLMEEQGFDYLPGQKKLNEMGRSDLANAIVRTHGGFNNFRPMLEKYLGKESEQERLKGLLENYVGAKNE